MDAPAQINASLVAVLRGTEVKQVRWRDVVVGDIVQVQDRKFFPADLILLSSANPEGVAYIETMNLDGETNLKIKKALKRTWGFDSAPRLAELKAQVDCEQPNNSLYTFTGNLVMHGETLQLSPNQVLALHTHLCVALAWSTHVEAHTWHWHCRVADYIITCPWL